MSQQKTPMPEKTWAITEQDKERIRDLGRKLIGFFEEHFKGEEHVPFKIIIGAFQYVGDRHDQMVRAIGDDFAATNETIARYGLSEKLEEPFAAIVPPPEESKEEKRARLQAELAELDKPEPTPDPDVEAASVAPSANAPVPVTEGPAGA